MNKYQFCIAVATLAGSFATPAMATDQNINLSATVTSFCKIANSLTPTDDSAVIPTTNGDITVTPIVKTYSVVCNKATTTTLLSTNGGLSGPTAAGGFENVINYTAATSGFVTIAAGSTATTNTVGTNETLGSAVRGTPGSANIVVTVTPIANVNPLVEGSYADTLRVSVVPN